jgi:hypothetical protein
MTTLELAALAEAMAPYGIESFDEVLKPLWLGISAMANDPADACTFCRVMILNPCPASTTRCGLRDFSFGCRLNSNLLTVTTVY